MVDQEALKFVATVTEGQSSLTVSVNRTGKILATIVAIGGDKDTPPEIRQEILERIPTDAFRRVMQLSAALSKVSSHEDFAESWA